MARKIKKAARRGAIEFSITTIIVIVLGVVIIGLGLAFVGGLFDDLNIIRGGITEGALAEIGQLGGGTKFSAPSSVKVNEGGGTVVDVNVGNDGTVQGGTATFQVSVAPAAGGQQSAVTARLANQPTIQLAPGQQATFSIIVEASENALEALATQDTPAFVVTATANGRAYDSAVFIVDVEANQGLFG